MKTAGKLFPIIRHVIYLLFVLILGCAKPMAPPGGPVDRTPPEIISSTPASGSIGISIDPSIVIEFSEVIDAKSVEKALFKPLQITEYRWGSRNGVYHTAGGLWMKSW